MSIFDRKPDPEQERYQALCQVVTLGLQNFRKTGQALREIRESQLWRFDCKSWEECCRKHWQMSPQHAGRLIDAALFADQVEPTGSVPQSENQLRPLRQLPESERVEAWTEAAAEGATPAAIARAVAKRKTPGGSRGKQKPIRIKVPGGTVIIEPNRRFHGAAETLEFALQIVTERTRQAA